MISIVMPIYNSKNLVENTVRSLAQILDSLCLDYEILLRDDGSSDDSVGVLKKLSDGFQRVRCFYNKSNRGLGFTLKRLFHDAKGENIIYCDCDLPFGEKVITLLLKEIGNNDIVIASRYSGRQNHVRVLRRIVSRAYYLFCRLLFNISIKDIGSGSVALKKKVLNNLDLRGDGFVIHVELYSKALKKGYSVKEIAIETTGCQPGNFSILKHGVPALIDTVKLKLNLL